MREIQLRERDWVGRDWVERDWVWRECAVTIRLLECRVSELVLHECYMNTGYRALVRS